MKTILITTVVLGVVLCGTSFAGNIFTDMRVSKIEYYPNGKIKAEHWKGEHNLENEFYYPNGNARQVTAWSKDGQIQVVRNNYESGLPLLELGAQGNQLSVTKYYPSGKVQALGTFDLEEIISKRNSKTGEVILQMSCIAWDASNRKIYDEQGNLLQNGVYKEYSEKGKLSAETPLENGKANGVGKVYAEDGTISAEIIYENDKEVSRKEYDK